MKKLLLLFILALGFPAISLAQQYGWKDIGANIPGDSLGHDLSDVFFVSDNEGWITSSTHAEIYHTTDGGETFELQTTPLGATIAIHMLDENHGYAGGDGGWIYVTENGGVEWSLLGSIGTRVLDISFPPGTSPDNPIGYACGGSGNVWEITSTLTNLNTGSSVVFSGISAASIEKVWVTGGNRIYYYNGIEFLSQSGPLGTFNDIQFINEDEGWVVGNVGVIGSTLNGGDYWTQQVNPDLQNRGLYGVFFIDSNIGWAVGFEGILLQTTDGGNTWTEVGENLQNFFYNGVHFTSATNGYIVGNNRTLLKYTEVSGVEDNARTFKFDLFPNPADETVRINCSEFKTEAGTIEILSAAGKTLQKITVSKGNEVIEMDLKDLTAGMYMCRITIGNKSSTRKLIIE